MCLLAALIDIYVDVATKDVSGTESLIYWWAAAAIIGLMAVAAHYVLTGDR
jgi:hypothetical protein